MRNMVNMTNKEKTDKFKKASTRCIALFHQVCKRVPLELAYITMDDNYDGNVMIFYTKTDNIVIVIDAAAGIEIEMETDYVYGTPAKWFSEYKKRLKREAKEANE